MYKDIPTSKVFYRPIEAAIRWAGLLRYLPMILATIASPRFLPPSLNCPRWNECRLYSERIYDGILNGELPYGQNGITLNDPKILQAPDLTVRHVDLKRWMHTHYPEHRPRFLFSRGERMAHPFISLETGQAILVERLTAMSQTPVLPPNERRILRLDEVEAKSGFKRAHIYNLMKKRQFPQALRLGVRAVGWDSIEIDQWIAERLNHRT